MAHATLDCWSWRGLSVWVQYHGPAGAAGGAGDDLAVVVDRGGVLDRGRSGRDQGVEVLHRAAAVDVWPADHHAVVVDRRRVEAAEVGHGAVVVQEPIGRAGAGGPPAGDLAVVVDR